MSEHAPRTGFRRLGDVSATELPLPGARARTLRFLQSWRRLAGDAIARNVRSVEIRRGVLEIRVTDRSWSRALAAHLPDVARRLAAECPDLGLRAFRLAVDGDTERADAVPIAAAEAQGPRPHAAIESSGAAPESIAAPSAPPRGHRGPARRRASGGPQEVKGQPPDPPDTAVERRESRGSEAHVPSRAGFDEGTGEERPGLSHAERLGAIASLYLGRRRS